MDEPKSKSQAKREAAALQKLGVEMVNLTQAQLDQIPLNERLRKAILEAKSIKSHGAKRRHAQLIGKLMRGSDSELIINAYNALIAESDAKTHMFHEVEHWRERLIEEGNEALAAFISHYQPEDIQQLRQLIKKAVDDHKNEKNTGAAKALFRYLRSCVK